ncbi:MAG: DUF1559 domain-containing protein [Armatimonadetes bacterium]|nr:DUF1559 domain-containing protein [Armatimonadota bacterium]
MKRTNRGITLIEVVAAAALLLLAAGITRPIWGAQSTQEKGRQTQCISNIKQLAQGLHIYTTDYDDYFALATTLDERRGEYRSNQWHSFPWNWRSTKDVFYWNDMLSHWTNSVYSYVQNYGIYACPSSSESPLVIVHGEQNVYPRPVSYTYNGLLHSYPAADIASPMELTVFWEGAGKQAVSGLAISQPALLCSKAGEPCRYQPKGGPESVMWKSDATYWIHNKGANFAYADTHAQWRPMGKIVANEGAELSSPGPPFTDWRADPFTGYNERGFAGFYWTYDGHPYLFRPDNDFGDVSRDDMKHQALTKAPSVD